MELEVEEDVEAAVAEVRDEGVAGGVVELHPYLEPLAGVAEGVDEVESLAGVGEVEGYGQAVFWVEGDCFLYGHETSLAAVERWKGSGVGSA